MGKPCAHIVTIGDKKLVFENSADFKAWLAEDGLKQLQDAKLLPENYNKEGANEPPTTTSPTKENSQQEEGKPERRFTKQELNKPELTKVAKAEIQKNLNYVKQANVLSVGEARQILDNIGVDDAYDLVVNSDELHPAVRSVLGQILILKYNDLAIKADNEEDRNYYHDKTVAIANHVSEKFGTAAGQMIQALSLFQRLSPEAQLRAAVKEVKKIGEKQKDKKRKDVNKISEKFKKANEETANEITDSKKVQDTANKVKDNVAKNAKDKITKAREKREKLKKKRIDEKGKGKPLFSSIGGLTPEGIEYVGELALTYIQEGIATIELIAQNIINDLKELSDKEPDDLVKNDVNRIVRELYDKKSNEKIASSLKELEKSISEIIKEHYTVSEAEKRSLVNKFIDDLGLDKEDAAQLAKEIETEFDKIATRKKRQIISDEKSRFERIKGKKIEGTSFEDQIIKFTNLGAFDDEQLLDFMAKKLGVGELTVDEARKIRELSEKIQNAPEGSPKQKATEDLLAYRANLKGVSWGEIAQAVWYANVLSGYGTHLKNIVSTFFNGMAFFGSEAVRDPKSIPALVIGGLKGLKIGAIEAWHTIETGETPIHINKAETPETLERKRFIGGYLNPANYLKFVGRLMKAEDVLQFQGLKEMRATQLAYREAKKEGYVNPFSKQVWKYIDEKLLNTKERYDEASMQAIDEGFKGREKRRRIYELMEMSRPIQMTEDAYGFAAKGTFNHETEGTLGAITNAIAPVLDLQIKGVKPIRFLIPFSRIITNVANNMMDFSPVGYVRAYRGVRGFQSFEKNRFTKGAYHVMTTEERAQAVAKASLGIGLTLALYALSKIPLGDDDKPLFEITGGGTGDYKKDAQLKQSGWQPYSIKFGDKYYSYALTPLILNLAWIGNRNDREKYDKDFEDESFLMKDIMSIYQAGQMLSDMTWIGTSADLLKSFTSLKPKEMAKGIENTLGNAAKGFILPNMYTQIAQKYEQINGIPQKQVDGIWQNFVQDIPIARNSLNDKVNALGDPIVRDKDIMISEETKDPIWKFLLDKKGWIAPVNKNSIIIFDSKTSTERKITDDEYYEFSKKRGSKIKAALLDVLENGYWVTEDGKATIDEDVAAESKEMKDITTANLQKLLKSIATKASKQTKKEMFDQEGSEEE